MTDKKAQIFVRTQHSRGSSANYFGGPDVYVAVILRDADKPAWNPFTPLNRDVLAKRGYEFVYCGEGYSHRTKTERSAFGKAFKTACEIAVEQTGSAIREIPVVAPWSF